MQENSYIGGLESAAREIRGCCLPRRERHSAGGVDLQGLALRADVCRKTRQSIEKNPYQLMRFQSGHDKYAGQEGSTFGSGCALVTSSGA